MAITPGFLRSEAALEQFAVAEADWRDTASQEPNFSHSQPPDYLGRAVAALAAAPPRRQGQDRPRPGHLAL
ncbi:hypothetical protein AB0953_22880 [Streptomyces sp. NPDC046866]|uniref:hypothetical protein n=1 Tax=Streptomyces sp. NPDC046866 TaxID=3154921 RepID=UPI003451B2DC